MKKHKFLKIAVISVAAVISLYGIIFGIDLVRFVTSGDEHIAPVVCLTSYSCKCGESKGEEGIFYGYHYSYRYVENIKNDKPSSKYFEF